MAPHFIRIQRKMSKNPTDRLVVDDDAMSRKILAQMLVSAGYECHESDNGAEALNSSAPSSLLPSSDFDMPTKRRRSAEGLAWTAIRPSQIPAIMLTGHGMKRGGALLAGGRRRFRNEADQRCRVARAN
jgi:CheY-like chemotaxis protein